MHRKTKHTSNDHNKTKRTDDSKRSITGPARAFIQLSFSVLDEVSTVSGLTVQGPIWVSFDVRITDNDQLQAHLEEAQ